MKICKTWVVLPNLLILLAAMNQIRVKPIIRELQNNIHVWIQNVQKFTCAVTQSWRRVVEAVRTLVTDFSFQPEHPNVFWRLCANVSVSRGYCDVNGVMAHEQWWSRAHHLRLRCKTTEARSDQQNIFLLLSPFLTHVYGTRCQSLHFFFFSLLRDGEKRHC